MPTVALVQQKDSYTPGSSSASVTLSSTPTANNLLVLVSLDNFSGPNSVTNGTWNVVSSVTQSSHTAEIRWKIASGSESTTTTASYSKGPSTSLWLSEWSGIETGTTIDMTGSNSGSSTSVNIAAGLTDSRAGLAIGAALHSETANNTDWSPATTNGYTLGFTHTPGADNTAGGYRVEDPTGALDFDGTATTSTTWVGSVATFLREAITQTYDGTAASVASLSAVLAREGILALSGIAASGALSIGSLDLVRDITLDALASPASTSNSPELLVPNPALRRRQGKGIGY